jgi:hypothetical protein
MLFLEKAAHTNAPSPLVHVTISFLACFPYLDKIKLGSYAHLAVCMYAPEQLSNVQIKIYILAPEPI